MYASEANRRLAERRNVNQSGVVAPTSRAPARPTVTTPQPKPKKSNRAMEALGFITSGEKAVNYLSDEVLEKIPGFGKDRHSGTRIINAAKSVPLVGGALGFAADVAMSPLTIATAGFGGPAAGVISKAGPIGRAAAGFITPIARSGGFGTRMAAETGVATAGHIGSHVAEESVGHFTDNETARSVAGLAGGLAGGLYAARSLGNAQKYYAMTPAERSGLPADDARRKLLEAMTSAREENTAITRGVRQEQGVRTSRGFAARQGIADPVAGMRASKAALGGQMDIQSDLRPLGPDLSETDVSSLWSHITGYAPFKTQSHEFEYVDTVSAMNKLLVGERVEKTELNRLGKVLGISLNAPQTGWKAKVDDVWNLPRSVMSSMDFSAPFTQGVVAVSRPEFWKAWGPGLKAFYKDEQWVRATHDEVMNRPDALMRERAGVHISPMFESVVENTLHEEAFRSSLAEHLPLIGGAIRRSNYAYTTFLNKLRADLFTNQMERWAKKGGATDEQMKQWGSWVNTITGRGNMSNEGIGKMFGAAGNLMFSPRRLYAWGEAVNPMTYAKADPKVRKEMMRDLAGFLGAGVGALTLMGVTTEAAKKMGVIDSGAQVTLDPRSSDFAKARIGETHFNPWGGLQPLMRYGAQILTGQRTNSVGETHEMDRMTAAGRFAQSKLAPSPGFIVDWLRGESYLGEEFDVGTDAGLSRQAAERLAPLFLQDFAQAIKEEGLRGALKQAPAITGVGVQTYGDFAQVRNDAAKHDYNMPWDRLTATEKDDIEVRYAKELAATDRDVKEGQYRYSVVEQDERTRILERDAAQGLDTGALDARAFNARMQDIGAERALTLRGLRKGAGLDDDPNGLVSRYLALREEATMPGGLVDYAILDQLQESFKAGLTDPQDRRIVEDFSTFDHDDSVSWYFDAKRKLQTSGYWAEEQKATDRFRGAVQSVAPGARSRDELEMMARQSTNRVQQVRLTSLVARIDAETKTRRETMRRRDRSVDEALQKVYGATPINERKVSRSRRR